MPQQVRQTPAQPGYPRSAAPAPSYRAPALLPSPTQRPLANQSQQRPLPKPIIRAQMSDEEPRPPVAARNISLALPSPDELGISPGTRLPLPLTSRTASEVDWNTTYARLRQLGAVGVHLDKLAGGNVRVMFTLSGGQAGQTHVVEVIADTEAAAVQSALQRAEQWVSR